MLYVSIVHVQGCNISHTFVLMNVMLFKIKCVCVLVSPCEKGCNRNNFPHKTPKKLHDFTLLLPSHLSDSLFSLLSFSLLLFPLGLLYFFPLPWSLIIKEDDSIESVRRRKVATHELASFAASFAASCFLLLYPYYLMLNLDPSSTATYFSSLCSF